MDSKQTDKNTNKRTNEEKIKTKHNKTKAKQNKTKNEQTKQGMVIEKKKKKKKKPGNLNEEWPLNESSMYCLKSQSRKEIFPETIYLSRQLFYAIFLAKTALLVYSCTSFLAQL